MKRPRPSGPPEGRSRTRRITPIGQNGARRALLILLAAACATTGAGAAAVDFRFGAERFEGEFGSTQEARLTQVPVQLVLTRQSSRLTLIFPYARIEQTGNVTFTADGPAVLGAGGPGRPGYQTAAAGATESGLGDIVLREEMFILRAGKGKRPFLSWILDLKVPTADEKKGLGTGKRDWGIGLSYVQPLGRAFQILGDASYRFMGDPEGIDFNDRQRLAAGFAVIVNRVAYRALVENVTPLLDEVPVFDDLGIPTLFPAEVEDRRVARVDLTVRSPLGGTTRIGVTKGLNDSSEDLGFFLEFSSGGR
jgi:hypothetical protein